MSNGWTAERKLRQAELIRRWAPWERSTGPKSEEGKARSARNADKPNSMGRQLTELKQLVRAIKTESKMVRLLMQATGANFNLIASAEIDPDTSNVK